MGRGEALLGLGVSGALQGTARPWFLVNLRGLDPVKLTTNFLTLLLGGTRAVHFQKGFHSILGVLPGHVGGGGKCRGSQQTVAKGALSQ